MEGAPFCSLSVHLRWCIATGFLPKTGSYAETLWINERLSFSHPVWTALRVVLVRVFYSRSSARVSIATPNACATPCPLSTRSTVLISSSAFSANCSQFKHYFPVYLKFLRHPILRFASRPKFAPPNAPPRLSSLGALSPDYPGAAWRSFR